MLQLFASYTVPLDNYDVSFKVTNLSLLIKAENLLPYQDVAINEFIPVFNNPNRKPAGMGAKDTFEGRVGQFTSNLNSQRSVRMDCNNPAYKANPNNALSRTFTGSNLDLNMCEDKAKSKDNSNNSCMDFTIFKEKPPLSNTGSMNNACPNESYMAIKPTCTDTIVTFSEPIDFHGSLLDVMQLELNARRDIEKEESYFMLWINRKVKKHIEVFHQESIVKAKELQAQLIHEQQLLIDLSPTVNHSANSVQFPSSALGIEQVEENILSNEKHQAKLVQSCMSMDNALQSIYTLEEVHRQSTIKKQKNVLVVGGGGYLGAHIVQSLLKRGFSVKACVNTLEQVAALFEGLKFTERLSVFENTMLKAADYKNILGDCRYVIHCGVSSKSESSKDSKAEIAAANALFDGVKVHGKGKVRRIVVTGSLASIYDQLKPKKQSQHDESMTKEDVHNWSSQSYVLRDESIPFFQTNTLPSCRHTASNNESSLSSQSDSKQHENASRKELHYHLLNGKDPQFQFNVFQETNELLNLEMSDFEEKIWRLKAINSLNVTVFSPSIMIGPALTNEVSGGMMFLHRLLMQSRYFPLAPDISWCFVDVRDVAEAHIRAIELPQPHNERYVLNADCKSIVEIGRMISSNFACLHPPRCIAPSLLVHLIIKLYFPENENPFPSLLKANPLDTKKAFQTFSFVPRSFHTTIIDSVKFIQENDSYFQSSQTINKPHESLYTSVLVSSGIVLLTCLAFYKFRCISR